MKPIELSVRCTREEYMNYAARRGERMVLLTVFGVSVTVIAVLLGILAGTVDQLSALLLFVGVLLMLADPLILPMLRKGEAARQYDRSDNLRGAVTLRLDDTTLYVRTATDEATLPLDATTEVTLAPTMIVLVFGQELTVCIPKRVLQPEETEALREILTPFVTIAP